MRLFKMKRALKSPANLNSSEKEVEISGSRLKLP
jgi:hypothetical protein